jgi:hypothetical protein
LGAQRGPADLIQDIEGFPGAAFSSFAAKGAETMDPPLAAIVAVAENGVIGLGNGLPWHISSDLKRFRALTLGKPLTIGSVPGPALWPLKIVQIDEPSHKKTPHFDDHASIG